MCVQVFARLKVDYSEDQRSQFEIAFAVNNAFCVHAVSMRAFVALAQIISLVISFTSTIMSAVKHSSGFSVLGPWVLRSLGHFLRSQVQYL